MTEKLTNAQIQELQGIFNIFDKNSKGTISSIELGTIMRMLSMNPTEAELSEMIGEIDFEGSGTIDFNEFLTIMSRKLDMRNIDDEIKEAFMVFDKNKDGFINSQEFREVMINLGEKLTEEEIGEMLKEADIDGDGKISIEEFTKVMTSK